MAGADIDQILSGMAKAEIFGSGNYMSPGLYTVETKRVFVKDGFKGKTFVAEFTVLESNNPKHTPGSSGSWVLKFEWKATFGHITKYVAAILGLDPNDKKVQADPAIRQQIELIVRAACGSDIAKKELGEEYEEGMLEGVQLRLECSTQQTVGKKQDFTVYNWTPITS